MKEDTAKEFDVRVVQFHLRHRNITEEDHAKYVAAIPDDAAECEQTDTRFTNAFERRYFSGESDED